MIVRVEEVEWLVGGGSVLSGVFVVGGSGGWSMEIVVVLEVDLGIVGYVGIGSMEGLGSLCKSESSCMSRNIECLEVLVVMMVESI